MTKSNQLKWIYGIILFWICFYFDHVGNMGSLVDIFIIFIGIGCLSGFLIRIICWDYDGDDN